MVGGGRPRCGWEVVGVCVREREGVCRRVRAGWRCVGVGVGVFYTAAGTAVSLLCFVYTILVGTWSARPAILGLEL